MSFEDFDQQINDAADKHHPAYREEAWSKMEHLLDKHLPQERKRNRRIFLWLPLLLLLSVGGFFAASNFIGNNDKVISQKSKPESGDQGSGTGDQQPATSNQSVIRNPQSANQLANNRQPGTGNSQPSANRNPPTASKNNTEKPLVTSRKHTRPAGKLLKPVTKNDDDEEEEVSDQAEKATSPTEEKSAADVSGEPIQPLKTDNTETPKPTSLLNNDKAQQQETNNQQPVTNNRKQPATRKPLPAKSFSNAFAVTLNGGADMSAVRFSESGQKRLTAGIGLQYQFHKNLAVRTGIFQTNKVYGAKPGDYNGYIYTPMGYSLSSVNGDCRVYEIPVSIAYTFNPNKKTSFFAAVGASSMIMKKEDYVYNYKSAYGQEYAYNYGVQNKNQHLFSSIDLSAGIQQNLNNRFFFRAEPYLRLPVHGVGLGNIKLKSAGIMLTAGIKPFARK